MGLPGWLMTFFATTCEVSRVSCYFRCKLILPRLNWPAQQESGRKGAVHRDVAPCTGGRFDRAVRARAAPNRAEIAGPVGRRPAIPWNSPLLEHGIEVADRVAHQDDERDRHARRPA